MFLQIFKREVSANKFLIFWYAVAHFAAAVLYIALFPVFADDAELMEQFAEMFPEGMLEVFGMSEIEIMTTYEGFMSMEYFSFFWIILVAASVITLGRKLMAKEVEDGTSDVLFALPEKRYKIFFAKFASYYLFTLFLVAATVMFVFAGGLVLGEDVSLANFSMFIVMGGGVSFLLLSFVALFSAWLTGGGKVAGIGGAFFLGSYVLHVAAILNETVENFYFLSFFKYYGEAYNILGRGLFEWGDLMILMGVGVILFAISLYIAEKRDL